MKIGDRVILVKPFGGFPVGCKGVVTNVDSDNGFVNVMMDVDEQGAQINPPIPLAPTYMDTFQVID